MNLSRLIAVLSIAVTGSLLLVPNVVELVTGPPLLPGVLAVLGSLLSLVLIVASALLYRSNVSTNHVFRVAGWNLLGLVVLGGVLLLATAFTVTTAPAYVIADILAVSAFAHLVIGVNDVLRIRATELAREREKLAVVNRLLRHNLRHEAQILMGYGDLIEDDTVRTQVTAVGDRLAEMHDRAEQLQRLLEDLTDTGTVVELSSVVDSATDRLATKYPDAEFEVSVPADLAVNADERLERVVYELVENAILHADGETVSVRTTTTDNRVELAICDEGAGVPEMEQAVLNREKPITQLSHSKGFGLWLSKWLTEAAGGDLGFGDSGNSAVVVRLHRAGA